MSGQTIALSLFLFLVAFGVVIFLGSFIFIKRSIARRKSRIGRIVYAPVGNGGPKFWKELVNSKINVTVKIRPEPRVFYSSNSDRQNDTAGRNLGFQFRANTVDLFVDLKEKILASYPLFEAPPVRGIKDFLLSASSQSMNPKPDSHLVETYCEFYNRARYDPGVGQTCSPPFNSLSINPYTDVDYLRFLEIHDQLLKAVVVKEALQTADSPNKATKASHKRRKMPSASRVGQSTYSELIEMKDTTSGSNVAAETNSSSGAMGLLRAPLSRSGSAASDDSQTALIRLDDGRNTSSHLRQ
ncbi:hypothetical protein EGR_00231 [Echinococcus granulosus]|uniref:NICE 3 family protein n=1 Tax=Echinococcus granulosus TaxID=6210 RepID=W6V1Z7_ECHGR|nr:hypothetical protein EGR_00231 [Echinococcus granulosus]EUB64962.1 hypothetical protein EGR_00231 [Echinococcus granulosus]